MERKIDLKVRNNVFFGLLLYMIFLWLFGVYHDYCRSMEMNLPNIPDGVEVRVGDDRNKVRLPIFGKYQG